MTVLMHDAVQQLSKPAKDAYEKGDLADLTFADDTLLLGVSAPHVEEFLRAVSVAAQQYGLSLHYGKLHLLGVNNSTSVRTPIGGKVEAAQGVTYLGTLLTSDGRINTELARRIGMARGHFRVLSKVWLHSTLNRPRKVKIFNSLITSKLLYSLAASCPLKGDLRRLDGFHCRCVRQIFGILPAFLSRISNAEVFRRAGCMPMSVLLRQRQMILLGRVLRAPVGNPLQSVSFVESPFSQQLTSSSAESADQERNGSKACCQTLSDWWEATSARKLRISRLGRI
jgi:hypothetical protein